MKSILTALMLLIGFGASAQFVNIPDSNFKKKLLDSCYITTTNGQNLYGVDQNHNGEVDVSEAQVVKSLSIYGSGYVSTDTVRSFNGIQSFISLQNFELQFFRCSGIMILDNLSNLKFLRLYRVNGKLKLSARDCPQLDTINLYGHCVHSLDVSNCNQLKELIGIDLSIDGIPELTSLNVTNCHKLENIEMEKMNLSKLDLSSCDSLRKFGFPASYIDTLDISGLKKIVDLTFDAVNGNFDIGHLDARNCSNLETLYNFNYGTIRNSINVSGCYNLRQVFFGKPSPNVRNLDFSTCYNLRKLIFVTYNLEYLNIKNGSSLDFSEIEYEPFGNTLRQVCADDFELNDVRNVATRNYYSISSYCSFFPGGKYNTIKGKIRLDDNINGCDSLDRGIYNIPIRFFDSLSSQSSTRFSNGAGDYYVETYKGNFRGTPYFPYPYFNIGPSTTQVNFDTANSLINTSNFCIAPNGVHNDLEIAFLPTWPPARPGFAASYQLIYKNRGTTTLSGQVQLGFDGTKMSFTSASAAPTTQSAGQLNWNYSNLAPFESRTVAVNFLLLPPPVNNSGDTIQYLATINPTSNDETPFDNSFILPQRVTGSYDPNDKQCLQGANLDISNISKPLDYLIRFQNLGTDTAFNVVIADTLNTKFDPTSVTITGSSHPCSVRQKNNQLEFVFENIRLPYKAINEPASNGFVAFKVKPKNTVVVGDTLSNRASIYFDFNLPVVTNKANTVIRSGSNPLAVSLEYFSANKQGGVHRLQWKANSNTAMVTFVIERSTDGIRYNNIGNLSANTIRLSSPFSFEDAQPLRGRNYYRLKMTDASGAIVYSKVALLDNPVAGIQVQAFSTTGSTALLYLSADKAQRLELKLIGADGRQYFQTSKTINQGNNTISLTLPKLAAGVYSLLLYGIDGGLSTFRIKI